MKLAIAILVGTTGCHDHPCTISQAELDLGDPVDGYCAAIDVDTHVDHDRVVGLLGFGAVGTDQPIRTPQHPDRPERFALVVARASPHSDATTLEAWSPLIDEGWHTGPVLAWVTNGGVLVASGGAILTEQHPDGEPTYLYASVATDAPSPAIELWGNVETLEGPSPCARYEDPSGTVFFFVDERDWDCDGVANISDTTPTG